MPAIWTGREERMYQHVLDSCRESGKSKKTCKRIAGATVNKSRRAKGKTPKSRCTCPKGSTQTKKGACKNRKSKRYVKRVCKR